MGPGLLGLVPLGSMMQRNTFLLQAWEDLIVEQIVLPVHQRVHGALHFLEGFVRGPPVRADHFGILSLLFFQAGNPDFEELIQIGADDTHVAQPLKQGRGGVLGHRQHSFVELEQRQLAIQQQGFVRQANGHY
ncbi:Uncharacterised protein [Bordetella trematum]|nr:Uncharacterised protein [Bordetella trematum]